MGSTDTTQTQKMHGGGIHMGLSGNAAIGGITTGARFWVGDKFTGIMATQKPTSLNPVIAGNALGAWITESVNAALEHEGEQGDKLPAEKK